MDFYKIKEKTIKNGVIEIFPDFRVCRSKDLMVKGKSFYSIWDEERNLWSTDEYDVQRIIDVELRKYKDGLEVKNDARIVVKYMSDFSSGSWAAFKQYMAHISDNAKLLDNEIVFSDTEVTKESYASKKLNYPLVKGSIKAYEELISTLYEKEEREKLEWAIGAIISGDAKNIQKFIVLYGEGGTGKSTILNIIQKLFHGYYAMFEAKALTSSNNSFATEVFKSNPLVAIQHDGDLSKIEDNTKLNSIVSHEEMTMNEKYKSLYTSKVNCFLFVGTNKPVKITDSKSGIIRRLIDVRPSGNRLPPNRYHSIVPQVDFELGAIAYHCLQVYRKLGKNYYAHYKPIDMMFQTDVFFNFVEAHYDLFKEQDGVTLKQAYTLYKEYCEDSLIDKKLPRYKFREELRNYFKTFVDVSRVNGIQVRSYYEGFICNKIEKNEPVKETIVGLVIDTVSDILDEHLKDSPAQLATKDEKPSKKWDKVKTKLSDIDSSKIHYVKPPKHHIVIDFDLKDADGNKSLELNLKAANKWPPTYAELSKSGNGVHLHYIYPGDTKKLERIYEKDIEIKVFTGNASLRRKLTKSNNTPIATISSGIPMKGEKMIDLDTMRNEQGLRALLKKNLRKEIHPGTKPSIDFIHKILEEAYTSGVIYDLRDMRPRILAFANNSSNQSEYCLELVREMKFVSEAESVPKTKRTELIFFDVEVFPNLLVICWKLQGKTKAVVKMINPTPKEIEPLLDMNLIGFNNRRYDNHILYAAMLGYTNKEIYECSQRIISNSENAMFRDAYNISYTDIYDFSSKKQSLKKFQIDLGIHHEEAGIPWDKPVDESLWPKVVEYCANDVISTEAVFEARAQDWEARLIISELSGLTPNDTTQRHTAKIIFGDDKQPQKKFVYTDLSEMFPGYKYSFGKSEYKGENPGEGGYVYAEQGIYNDVALIDVASMHPTSLILLKAFGPYTQNFTELVDARLAVKHKDFEKASTLLGGVLTPFLKEEKANDLAYALKIVINIVYGLTSAKFDNPFKDPRNVDNIVAKRGALFMMDLKDAVQKWGFIPAHIKTDSIKIPNATDEIIAKVMEFGEKYGYVFEHEATYEKLALVNDAVYICKAEDGWHATGAQFAHPYVFKKLFSKEEILFEDLIETKAVQTALYLNMNEEFPDGMKLQFIGKVGGFVPIKSGYGGGLLLREKEGKYYAATGTKGYRWLEAEYVKNNNLEKNIDYTYYDTLCDKAINNISQYGDFDEFQK